MIPKVIHYCWFGHNPLPSSAKKCIKSWEKYFPDYEIKEWNEQNYNVCKNRYICEAYKEKKYAFVSDYARFDILYQYGGIYFDVDVEVIKDMSAVLERGAFMGCERKDEKPDHIYVAPGLGMAAEAHMEFIKKMLNLYNMMSFYDSEGQVNQKTIVAYTTEELMKYGLIANGQIQHIAGFNIYPWEFFCPMDSQSGNIVISDNTYTIHHYMASWHTSIDRIKKRIRVLIGPKMTKVVVRIKNKVRRR